MEKTIHKKQSLRNKNSFKPIVASSVAMILGMNIASAHHTSVTDETLVNLIHKFDNQTGNPAHPQDNYTQRISASGKSNSKVIVAENVNINDSISAIEARDDTNIVVVAGKANIGGKIYAQGSRNYFVFGKTELGGIAGETVNIKDVEARNKGGYNGMNIITALNSSFMTDISNVNAKEINTTKVLQEWKNSANQAKVKLSVDGTIQAIQQDSYYTMKLAFNLINVQELMVGKVNSQDNAIYANLGANGIATTKLTVNGNVMALEGINEIHFIQDSQTQSSGSSITLQESKITGNVATYGRRNIIAWNIFASEHLNFLNKIEDDTTRTAFKNWLDANNQANAKLIIEGEVRSDWHYGRNIINVKELEIKKGIKAIEGGSNFISAEKAIIKGDIYAELTGSPNAIFIGKSTPTASVTRTTFDASSTASSTITGNIIAIGGSNSIILEDGTWTPYANLSVTETNKNFSTQVQLSDNSGILTNRNGTTNLVFRKSNPSTTNTVLSTAQVSSDTPMIIPVYKIISSGNAQTNIVTQGNLLVSYHIAYDSIGQNGAINLIFAHSNDNAADSFNTTNTYDRPIENIDTTDAVDIANNKVLGKTYKDGIKLSLVDKRIRVGDQDNQSFLNTYKHYFNTLGDESVANITTQRILDTSNNTQIDSVYLKGLALGNISPLASSTAAASSRGVSSQDGSDSATTYNYNVVIGEHSAFVGDIKLQNDALIHLVMEDSSKLLTDVEHLKLKSLTLKSSGYNTNEMLLDTFAQNNTIIDIATMGDALGNLKERSNFRLLEIGDAPSSGAGAVQASSSTGLKGSGALFRVYVNANATQGADNAIQKEADAQVDAKNATLGGNSNSGGANGKYGYVYSDRIIIHDALSEGDASSGTVSSGATLASTNTNYIQTIYDANTDIAQLTYHGGGSEKQGNIAVATVKTSSGITFKGATQIQGFDEVGTTLTTANTDQYGKVVNSNGENQASGNSRVNAAAVAQEGDSANTADYTTYFISSVESKGASAANTLASTTALGLNYDLFLANFNSLNKRMGELRDNNHSQGAWGRIFNGMLSTSYGLQTKSIYTTLQAGYDYAFGFNEANNYLGFALSYANSIIKPKTMLDIDGNAKGIDKTNSNAVELAIYNSYVEDSGWFNDTIFKFSFIMSSINMAGQSSNYNTNNYGIVLSDEFGYRFKLGNESEWYIDPQVEFSLGYFNASNLKQVLSEASLNGTQDAIFNLRSRLGANFAYDLKRFTQGKDIKASVYVGTYYAYDYIKGGEISLTTNLNKTTQLKTLGSTGRFELNLGTNVEIKDNTRIYFDFERSFGGDITTEYQVNLGVRYSFGEKINYAPEVSKSSAPLKVESKEETQKSESKEQESAQSKEEQKQ